MPEFFSYSVKIGAISSWLNCSPHQTISVTFAGADLSLKRKVEATQKPPPITTKAANTPATIFQGIFCNIFGVPGGGEIGASGDPGIGVSGELIGFPMFWFPDIPDS